MKFAQNRLFGVLERLRIPVLGLDDGQLELDLLGSIGALLDGMPPPSVLFLLGIELRIEFLDLLDKELLACFPGLLDVGLKLFDLLLLAFQLVV